MLLTGPQHSSMHFSRAASEASPATSLCQVRQEKRSGISGFQVLFFFCFVFFIDLCLVNNRFERKRKSNWGSESEPSMGGVSGSRLNKNHLLKLKLAFVFQLFAVNQSWLCFIFCSSQLENENEPRASVSAVSRFSICNIFPDNPPLLHLLPKQKTQ